MNKYCTTSSAGLLCVLTMCPHFASAQVNGLDLDDPEMQRTIRMRYVGSPDLPDGIAYISTLQMITGLNSDDPETAKLLVMQNMGLRADAAQEFVALLVASTNEFSVRIAERSRDIACDNGIPRAFGDDVFLLLEAMEDASDGLSEQHFVEFKETLNEDTEARLQAWINVSKRSINHTRFNQKELALKSGMSNVDAELSALCAGLERAKGGSIQ